jgi:hypothetical protein
MGRIHVSFVPCADVMLIPTRSNVTTPTPGTTEPTVVIGDLDAPKEDGDRSTGDSMVATNDETTAPPDPLDTEMETSPPTVRPMVRKIKVIGPRPPLGYVSSDSESNVERLVLPGMDIE